MCITREIENSTWGTKTQSYTWKKINKDWGEISSVYFLKLSEPCPSPPPKITDRTTNLKNQNLPRIYTRKLDDYVTPQTSEKWLTETASRETQNCHHQPIGKHRLLIWNSTELSGSPARTNLLVLKQSRTQTTQMKKSKVP